MSKPSNILLRIFITCTLLVGGQLFGLQTASAAEYPKGIYCSCPGTHARSHSVKADVASLDFVEGILVRVYWGELNPAEDVYDWSLLDTQLQRAENYDKKIALGVVNGNGAPAWIYQAGADNLELVYRGTERKLPIAWDPVYLSKYTKFIAALGERYAGNERITLVHMTNSTTNGFEMQLNLTDTQLATYIDKGFTNDAMIDSWKTIMAAYHSAFPDTYLDVDVHPLFRDPLVAQEVVKYGAETIGKHFGAFAAWWTLHNATNAYPDMYDIMAETQTASFATIQLAKKKDNFDNESDYYGTLDLAWDTGIRYMEVWDADLLNGDLRDYYSQLSTEIVDEAPVAADEPPVSDREAEAIARSDEGYVYDENPTPGADEPSNDSDVDTYLAEGEVAAEDEVINAIASMSNEQQGRNANASASAAAADEGPIYQGDNQNAFSDQDVDQPQAIAPAQSAITINFNNGRG